MLCSCEKALIKRFQPYERRYFSDETFGLGYLEWLNATDKHRRLNVIQQEVNRAAYFSDPNVTWTFRNIAGTALEDGAEIAVATCKVPNPDVQVHPDTAIGITISEGGIIGELRTQINNISDAVHLVFFESQRFF